MCTGVYSSDGHFGRITENTNVKGKNKPPTHFSPHGNAHLLTIHSECANACIPLVVGATHFYYASGLCTSTST